MEMVKVAHRKGYKEGLKDSKGVGTQASRGGGKFQDKQTQVRFAILPRGGGGRTDPYSYLYSTFLTSGSQKGATDISAEATMGNPHVRQVGKGLRGENELDPY